VLIAVIVIVTVLACLHSKKKKKEKEQEYNVSKLVTISPGVVATQEPGYATQDLQQSQGVVTSMPTMPDDNSMTSVNFVMAFD